MDISKNVNTEKPDHAGGNPWFWRNEMVQRYDIQQSLVSEKKEEVLANITRIINYFCKINTIPAPKILDVGCGPGTPGTISAYVLKDVPNCTLVGVDSSNQMVEAANHNLKCERFVAYVGDFNSDSFWPENTARLYDFIVSSGSLHYLADERRIPFIKEIYDHLENNGILIAGIGTCSEYPEICEMEQVFRTEFTYSRVPEDKKARGFEEFRKSFTEIDKKAKINWKNQTTWLDAIKMAGFRSADVVWSHWVRSIFLGIK